MMTIQGRVALANKPLLTVDDGTFSFTGIQENKYYILQTTSESTGETCTGVSTTPTQITDNVTVPDHLYGFYWSFHKD